MSPPHWTREGIIDALQQDARRRGRPPRASDWSRSGGEHRPASHTVWKRFGSWDHALAAAGLEPQGRGRWSRQAVIEALQRDARRRGRAPTMSEWGTSPQSPRTGRRRPTAQTAKTVFGSWRGALEAAGLEAQKSGGERWERCKRGHPLTGENVAVDSQGNRACLICRRAGDRERARELRAQRAAAGVCTRCGGERDEPERNLCASCRVAAQVKQARRRARAARASGASPPTLSRTVEFGCN